MANGLSVSYDQLRKYYLTTVKCDPKRERYWRGAYTTIADFFKDKEWSLDNIHAFYEDRFKKGNVATTVNDYIKYIKKIDKLSGTNFMKDEKYFPEDEVLYDTLTTEEVNKIIYFEHKVQPRFQDLQRLISCFVHFLFISACRFSEAQNLLWKNVNPTFAYVYQPKINKHKCVIITAELSALILRLQRRGEKVFMKEDGSLLIEQTINRELKYRAKLCGIKKNVSCHVLRHSHATLQAQCNRATLQDIQKLLGHTSPSSTLRYIHLTHEDIRGLVESLPIGNASNPRELVLRSLDEIMRRMPSDKVKANLVQEGNTFTLKIEITEPSVEHKQ